MSDMTSGPWSCSKSSVPSTYLEPPRMLADGDAMPVPTGQGAAPLRVLSIGEFDDDCAGAQPGGRLRYAVLCPDGRAWQPASILLLEVRGHGIAPFHSHAAAASAVVAFWRSHSGRFTEHHAPIQQGVDALGWLKSNEVLLAAEIVRALRLQAPFDGEPAAILQQVIVSEDPQTGAPRRHYKIWQQALAEAPRITAQLLCNLSVPDSRPRLVQYEGSRGISGYTDVRYAVGALRVLTSSRPSLPGMQDADTKWRRAAAISRKLSTMLDLRAAYPSSEPSERIRNTTAMTSDCFKAARVLGVDIVFAHEAFAPTSQSDARGMGARQ